MARPPALNRTISLAVQVLTVVAVLALLAIIYYIRFVFVMVAFAGLLAYLLDPVVRNLCDVVMPRWQSPTKRGLFSALVLVAFLVLMGMALYVVFPPIVSESRELINRFPNISQNLVRDLNEWGADKLGDPQLVASIEEFLRTQLGNLNLPLLFQTVIAQGASLLGSIVSFFAALILIPILAYWFLKDHHRFRAHFISMVPANHRPVVERTLDAINQAMGQYVRGQLTLMVAIFLITWLALEFVLDVKYSVLLAVIAGITEAIPNVGPVLGLIPALILTLLTDPPKAIWVFVAYMVIQLLENQFLAPRVMSEKMNLHPVTVILAILVGGLLGGVLGVLLALPLAAVAKVLIDVFYVRREEYLGELAAEGALVGSDATTLGREEITPAQPTKQDQG